MRNKYQGTCYYCGEIVEAGEGHFERDTVNHRWRTIHANCVFKQRAEKGKDTNSPRWRSRHGK